eukprot:gene25156-32816_t
MPRTGVSSCNRTSDLKIFSLTLSQLSYRGNDGSQRNCFVYNVAAVCTNVHIFHFSFGSATTQEGNGFSTINSKETFGDKFPAVTVVECARNDFLPNVILDEKAFECFLSYINLSLDLEEKFINLENEKGNYFFFFTLLSFIASCAEGIYASEAAVDNSASSIKMGVESNIVEDSGILINHEVILQCSKKESPKGPVEFTSVTKIRKVCRSVLEVKGYKVFGDHRNSRYQLFAQLVVAMEKNMELTPLVKNTILGAFASGESVLFAKIDMDSTKENFCIRHTEIFAFRHKPGGSSIKVFNPENSKLVVELFFSMVMNDGKHRLISHSAMQTSIDKFRTESEANEFIRIGKIVHVQKMEQQLRESEEREEKRIQEVREYEERLRQEIKEREEKL